GCGGVWVVGGGGWDGAGRSGAGRARHVLRHDGGLAGNVAPVVARERARIDVVAAARRRPDKEIDALTGVIIPGRGGCRGRGERDQPGEDACRWKAKRKAGRTV